LQFGNQSISFDLLGLVMKQAAEDSAMPTYQKYCVPSLKQTVLSKSERIEWSIRDIGAG
jgi:hypothetical protein